MGNVQVLSNFYFPEDSTGSPSNSNAGSIDDLNSFAPVPESQVHDNKIICEYCQEYCFPQFHQQHTRICPCNPVNIRPSDRSSTNSQSNTTSELQKEACRYCHEACFTKYKVNHERICPKNPENIKVSCRSCNKTLNLINYQNHLESCEENSHQRRRSVNPSERGPRTLHAGLRRSKTNNDITFKSCERQNPVKITKQEDLECPICLEQITSHFDLTSLRCNHKFHRHCIHNWSCVQRRCPICRKDFL